MTTYIIQGNINMNFKPLNIQDKWARAVGQALNDCPMSRKEVARQMSDYLGKEVGENMNAFKKTLAEGLLPALNAVIPKITAIVQASIKWAERNKKLVAILGSIAIGITAAASVIGPLLVALPLLSQAFLGVKIAIAAVRVVMLAMNATMLANPIVLAVAAIVAVVFLIYKNWDKLKPYFEKLWAGIKHIIQRVWSWFKTIFKWSPLGLIITNWSKIKNAICNPIKTAKKAAQLAWEGITSALANPVETAQKFIDKAMGGIKGLFSKAPSLSEWENQHNQSLAAINGHMSAIEKLTGARGAALDAIEKMTEAEKEQAKQHAQNA